MIQDGFIKSLVSRFHLDAASIEAPMDPHQVLEKGHEDHAADKNLREQYQSLIGSLPWPSITTRLDISFAVTMLPRFPGNPTQEHLSAAKRVLGYLKGSQNTGLLIDGCKTPTPEAFTHANYGGSPGDRRSVGADLLTLGGNPIAWKTGKQSIITTSSTEAEYGSLSLPTKEVITAARFLQGFMALEPHVNFPLTIWEDNVPAIKTALNEGASAHRTRHMDIRFHFIRQEVQEQRIDIQCVPTDQQLADGLTKALTKAPFQRFCDLVNLQDCSHRMHST